MVFLDAIFHRLLQINDLFQRIQLTPPTQNKILYGINSIYSFALCRAAPPFFKKQKAQLIFHEWVVIFVK